MFTCMICFSPYSAGFSKQIDFAAPLSSSIVTSSFVLEPLSTARYSLVDLSSLFSSIRVSSKLLL